MKHRVSKDLVSWSIFLIVLMPVITALILMQVYMAKDLEDTLIIIVGGVVTIAVCCFLLPIIKGDK